MFSRKIRIIALLAMIISLSGVAYLASTYNSEFPEETPVIFAAGAPSGMYERFGEVAKARGQLNYVPRTTSGTVENLQLLQDRTVDYALVQNDIAQYSIQGIRGQEKFANLTYVIPAFSEYVQILLPRRSSINVVSDLRGKRVCIGEKESGTYFNSIDVMADAGLRQSIDFFPVRMSAFECLEQIEAGEEIDAVFLTSNRKIADENRRFKQLYFSDTVASSLSRTYPYFRAEQSGENTQLVVDAFIATYSEQSTASVRAVTRDLVKNWDTFNAEIEGLPEKIDLENGPWLVPFHGAAETELERLGLKKSSYLLWVIGIVWLVLLALCLWAERLKRAYNRMGDSTLSKAKHLIMVKIVGRCSQLVIGLTLLVLFIAFAVYALRFVEDYFAQAAGVASPFARMTFTDSLVWLFTYITSGFTSDGVYPMSFAGRLIAAALAIVGLVAPITGIVYLINVANRQVQLNLQGLGRADLKNHIILCGWNEKAPGIIYTLTGEDVDHRKQVVLVASLEEKYPLEKYNFDPGFVTYCKGDPSDINVLDKACVATADSVIILADFKGGASHNKKSILACMNIRRKNENAHICAEIEHLDNVDYYHASGCNTLIHPSLIISRMAASTILSPMILDYIFDMITYHEFDELYSIPVDQISVMNEQQDLSVRQLEKMLFRVGVNLVGVIENSQKTNLYDASFRPRENSKMLLDATDSAKAASMDAVAIYSAPMASQINARSHGQSDLANLDQADFKIEYPDAISVLACGDSEALQLLEENLRSVVSDLRFTGVDYAQTELRFIEQIDQLSGGEHDKIVLMSTQQKRSGLLAIDDLNEIDSDIILLTRLFRTACAKWTIPPEIISEIGNVKNKKLFKGAGADYVLPTALLSERFLAKEAYDQNHVTDFLMAAMNLQDGIHLHCHTIEMGDGFEGHSYAEILQTQIEGVRIMGWLPIAEKGKLENIQDDFGFHFRTVIDHRTKSNIACRGDLLIMMLEKRERYYSVGAMPDPDMSKVD